VKDRKTRDAMRSVLERITGGGIKAAAPEAAAPVQRRPRRRSQIETVNAYRGVNEP
jgi:AsmA protein